MTDADGASEHDQAKRLRIVLADDHDVMRYGFQLVLDGGGFRGRRAGRRPSVYPIRRAAAREPYVTRDLAGRMAGARIRARAVD
jgi:hypothetical protein